MTMKLREIQRRRFPGRWVVFVCAFLAVCAFIAFEVLDVDGSNFQHPLRENAIAAEPTSADLEQLLAQAPSAPGAQTGVFLSLEVRLPPGLPDVRSRSSVNGICAGTNRTLPRASLRREPSSTALSDDPA
jgi:hypothetical protein